MNDSDDSAYWSGEDDELRRIVRGGSSSLSRAADAPISAYTRRQRERAARNVDDIEAGRRAAHGALDPTADDSDWCTIT